MARQKKSSSASEQTRSQSRSLLVHVIALVTLTACGGYGFARLCAHVVNDLASPAAPPLVTLKARPNWMSDALAEQIVSTAQPHAASSALDHGLLRDIAQTLAHNPWVRQVKQVRRVFGESAGDTIELDCEYRAPIALVASRNELILVDGEGVRLPGHFPLKDGSGVLFSPDGRVNIRVIDDVATSAPRQEGQKWAGEDLAAALDMVKLLYGRPCTEEIYRINVANFKGRRNPRDAQIVLITRYRSEIRWGEPVMLSFHAELSPVEKLERLALVRERFGRVDGGHSWLDIRLDKITYPAEEAPIVQAASR